MPRVVPRFGKAVNQLLEQRKWSERRAWSEAKERGEELSLSTLQGMSDGIVPGPEKVLALARTLDEDPNRLLGLAGWPFRYDPSVLDVKEDSDRRTPPLTQRSGSVGVLAAR